MKHPLYKGLACLALILALISSFGCKNDSVFQVNDVVSDPGAYSGPLTLIGVVYAYAESDSTIVGVMDKKELQCTTPNCEKVLLAVKVAGALPKIGDEVKVAGSMVKMEWGYLLEASRLDVLANHKLGGA